jgi:hypothetical protein
MKRILTVSFPLAALLAAFVLYPWKTPQAQTQRVAASASGQQATFRILFGIGDTEPTAWDGSVKANSARVMRIEGWRFVDGDSTDERASWKASTHTGPPGAAGRRAGRTGPIVDNGVLIAAVLESPGASFEVTTKQGSFSFTAQELPFGESKSVLNGRASIERVPGTTQLTSDEEDEDFPAVAQSGDDVWVAFVRFTHGDRSQAGRQFQEEPKSFDLLARPAGGDQVLLLHYSKSKNAWDTPLAVSAPKQDVVRPAVAVDGSKRVWVIWSANQNGNFDLYARAYSGGKWSSETRITRDAGTDLNPVAATDANGRVWVAWQAFRSNNLEILAAVQQGDSFGQEQRVSFSPASDWDPAIAASRNGEVAVSWDTYDKGDYDVYFRKLRLEGNNIRMDAPAPVAATQNFEARSSAAFDAQNRLWIAYEASDTKWGKDFGAYETSGIALYQGHNIRVKCFEGKNAFATQDELAESLPAAPAAQRRMGRRRARSAAAQTATLTANLTQPNPELAKNRLPSLTPQPPPLPLNSFPRLAADSEGTIYLAFRSVASAGYRSPLGTVWNEEVVWYNGSEWSNAVPVPNTDGLLDNRPGLAAIAPGHLLLVATSDHRNSPGAVRGRRRNGADALNSDIYAADLRVGQSQGAPKLKPLAAEKVAPPQADVKPEVDQVARMRNYRVALGSTNLQMMRGEFHRHTEISGDGGRDGPLIDAYRYMIDAAYMDWVACCDHDNGNGREYSWWIEQKLTDAYHLAGKFVPMFGHERSVRYPEGHRNVVMAMRGVRPLPRLPKMEDDSPPSPAPDTQMLYKYLKRFGGIVASHTSGTDMGTDWRDNDPIVEPVVEIYQGDRQNYEMPDAPRSNREGDSIGGWRPLGFVSLALQKGYRLGFQASSDHISTHMSYCNLWVTAPTREAIMEAFHKRRIYGATDNILADVRSGGHFMGEEFETSTPPSISVKLWGTANFAKVHIIKDNHYVYSIQPDNRTVDFAWQDAAAQKGKTSYYYVRGEQSDGELVWVSPLWITYR